MLTDNMVRVAQTSTRAEGVMEQGFRQQKMARLLLVALVSIVLTMASVSVAHAGPYRWYAYDASAAEYESFTSPLHSSISGGQGSADFNLGGYNCESLSKPFVRIRAMRAYSSPAATVLYPS